MPYARYIMGIILVLLGMFIAVVGWIADFLLVNLLIAVPLVIVGLLMFKGSLK